MDLELKDRVAVVTGGSAGIGLATAKMLITEAAAVHLVGRNEGALAKAHDTLVGDTDARVSTQSVDLSQPERRQDVVDDVLDRYGRCDILINNAGGSQPVPLDADPDVWYRGMELKFHAYRDLAHGFMPCMLDQEFGRIVNVTGTSESHALNVSHSATGATYAWAKGLSRTVGAKNVTVNSVAPNSVMSKQTLERNWPDEEARRGYAAENIPVGRFGYAEVVARTITYLVSPLTDFITGEIVHVDGGRRRYSF